MSKFILVAMVFISGVANAADSCKRYCNPDRSKPCGAACIPLDSVCRKSWTTSCSGERPAEDRGGKAYDKPKFVSERPKGG